MRQVLHVPIIHGPEDLGSLASRVKSAHAVRRGPQGLRRHLQMVRGFWEAVTERVLGWPFPPGATVRIYQDALPVSGVEERIVRELAAKGSANHGLLLRLVERGAVLMGTESPELLLEEVTLARRPAAPGGAAEELLSRRDAFIASRIDLTLSPGEMGVLFLGLLHRVSERLPADIELVHLAPDPAELIGAGSRRGPKGEAH